MDPEWGCDVPIENREKYQPAMLVYHQCHHCPWRYPLMKALYFLVGSWHLGGYKPSDSPDKVVEVKGAPPEKFWDTNPWRNAFLGCPKKHPFYRCVCVYQGVKRSLWSLVFGKMGWIDQWMFFRYIYIIYRCLFSVMFSFVECLFVKYHETWAFQASEHFRTFGYFGFLVLGLTGVSCLQE